MSGTKQWKLVIDLATDRIITYGDMNFHPGAGAVQAVYEGDLPREMDQSNCFSYRFKNKEIIPPTPSVKVALEDQNRDTVRVQIEEMVATARKPYLAANPTAQMLREHKLREALATVNGTASHTIFLPQVARQLGSTGLEDAAREVINRARDCMDALATSELVRVSALLALKEAKTTDEMYAVKRTCAEELKSIAN